MDELISNLLKEVSPPYLANKDWEPGKPVYYSGPYWDDRELAASIKSLLAGKWLPSGEEVTRFERKFSKKFNKKYSVMVNSGSSANLIMFAALKKKFGWQDGCLLYTSPSPRD